MIHRLLEKIANGYFRRCLHRSHRLNLRCYRGLIYDGRCFHHLRTCWKEDQCP